LSAKQAHVEVKADVKTSAPKYTRYERARIVGARSLQISMGAPVLLKDITTVEPIDVAIAELERNLIPITVKKINKSAKAKVISP
jgi:DNA-directed RNA polymerase subunit K